MARSGLAGPSGSLTTGFAFGIPPLFKFGSAELQVRGQRAAATTTTTATMED